MNGEQTAVMNEVAEEQNEPVGDAQRTELSSPHFDERAVAVAQPVEPLPSTPFRLSNLAFEPIAIVVAFGVVLIMVATAAGFLTIRSQPATMSESAAVDEPTSQPAEPPQVQTTPVDVAGPATAAAQAVSHDSDSVRSRNVGPRLHQRHRLAPAVTDEDGRPAARKIGEIRYGRASDRP